MNTPVSVPAATSSDSHLAIVLDVTALYGAKNNFCSPPLKGAVHAPYTVNATTWHNPVSCRKGGKKNSVISFPCLDCLARLLGAKHTIWLVLQILLRQVS